MNIYDALFSADLVTLNELLKDDPALANAEIPMPGNPSTAHPLHRICDGVSSGLFTEATALEIARVFIRNGASLNDHLVDGKDSPLTAACSLGCDQLAVLYIEQGALPDHRGCHGGTALHWASWCGRDSLVQLLTPVTTDINQRCSEFKSTPLFWAIHGYRFGGEHNRYHQVDCARILLDHGADPSIPNFEGYLPQQLLADEDVAFRALFNRS